jgi:GT2 family glycosyltransferase
METNKTINGKISIVITNMNGEKWIKNLILSIFNSDYSINELEIILVDNNSTDNSLLAFKELMRENKDFYIENKENLGWSKAVNQGFSKASGEIIIVLSNDMEIDNQAIKKIVEAMFFNRKIGIIQFNSLSLTDRKTLDSGMNFLDKFGYSYSYFPSKTIKQVFFAEGMAFAVQKEVIENVGFLDDSYFMEYDDMDYCWRTLACGYDVAFLPNATVFHARGGTVGSNYFNRNLRNIKDYTKNHLTTIIKNYELKTLLIILPSVVVIEFIKILYMVYKKKFKIAIANFKGIVETFIILKGTFEKRKYIQTHRKRKDKDIFKLMHPFQISKQLGFMRSQALNKRYFIRGEENEQNI